MYTNGQKEDQAKEDSGEASQNKKNAWRMRFSENGTEIIQESGAHFLEKKNKKGFL